MKKSVRIGGAGGFWGDNVGAMEQLLLKGDVDYIMSDYLAELTMAILAKAKDRDPKAGYATDFVRLTLKPILHEILRKKIRVVVNAGGINPRGCADALRELADKLGLSVRIGVVEGDDLMPREQELRRNGMREMFSGAPLPPTITSMNAYLGGFPIAEALARGADIVITGRCADSALALGPLIYEFGWTPADYNRLAGGSMAGHLIECGTQTTGGLFTDWQLVEGREDMGFPIAECYADGTFALTKPPATGGMITPAVAAEQMLYEVGDPRNYLLPDVTVDLADVRIEQDGPDLVRFTGFAGRPPSHTYKVSATYPDGYRVSAMLTMVGKGAATKARHVGEAILARTRNLFRAANLADYTETNIETLGSEDASFGEKAGMAETREVVLRLSVRHSDEQALQIFAREIAPFGTAGTPGTTGFSGRPKPQAVYRLFSFLVPKDQVSISVTVDGVTEPHIPAPVSALQPAKKDDPARFAAHQADGPTTRRSLRAIAVARSGDKADISHMAVIARHPDFYPLLREAVTPEAVRAHLSHLVRGEIVRYDVPGVSAVNFMLHEALGGGGTATLRNDALGKAFAEIMLDYEIDIPSAWIGRAELGN